MLRKARGGLKATVGNRVKPDYHFIVVTLCYRCIDDLIVFNNKKFGDYVKEIYPSQLTVEKANTSDDLANYLDLTFIIESNNRLYTKLYDKRDDFNFHIVNFHSFRATIDFTPSSMTNVMILISTLSIFHSFRAISHLAFHMVFIFPS